MGTVIWNRGGHDPDAPDPHDQLNRVRHLLGVLMIWVLVLSGATSAAWIDWAWFDVGEYAPELLTIYAVVLLFWTAIYRRVKA